MSQSPSPRPRIASVPVSVLAAALALLVAAPAAGARRGDAFLEGYVTAVVERDLGLPVSRVEVDRGRVRLVLAELRGEPAERVADALARVEGVRRVDVRVGGPGTPRLARARGEGPEDGGIEVLPRHELFDPLLADPREPHFSAVYQWYLDDDELVHVGSANFGESFALLGGELGEGRWELGLMGGVFSIFDLDAASSDLVNSDFWVGPTLSYAQGPFSARLRAYHQSSHLGDEFLLRKRPRRVNLSYEGLDLVVSAQVYEWLRIYGGGGAIVRDEPDLEPYSVQAGLELRSPITFLDDLVRPVAAFDFQAQEENEWHEELGAAAGIEIANPDVTGMRLLILGTWFRGNSPNGQFFERRIELLGIGAHLFL